MSIYPITITLPEQLYQFVRQQSEKTQRSMEAEITAVLTATLPTLPQDLETELSALELLTEQELWQAARLTAPSDKTDRMQQLVEKQQLEGLTEGEQQEAQLLSHFFNRIMLVRAKAAVLLKEQGKNIDSLLTDE